MRVCTQTERAAEAVYSTISTLFLLSSAADRTAPVAASDYPSLSEQACRKAISHYSENVVAKKYIDLYNKVTGRNA